MSSKPISDYGVVGDMRTAALIGKDGAVDWLCLPRFDSPSVFAAILDEKLGGHFTIAPRSEARRIEQLYQPDTNILVTRFLADNSVVELTDFMPVPAASEGQQSMLIRRVRAVSGRATLRLICKPAFHYATQNHEVEMNRQGAIFQASDMKLQLATSVPLHVSENAVSADFTLQESQTVSFVLSAADNRQLNVEESVSAELEEKTATYWRNWLNKCTYRGRWREMVHRSALLLELLTYAPTGAIVAAPSCSLPEWIGGERNWDYRYNWIRDAAYTIYALLRIGLIDEADRFMAWVEQRCNELVEGNPLQTVFGIDGIRDLREQTLDHLSGYCGSRPVRIGNGAFEQLQLDIYGALIDAVYLYNKYAQPITSELWKDVRRLVDWVCDNWQKTDHGIWEPRENPRPLVHSKVMCWVAIDRGLRLAGKRSLPADQTRWLATRDQIYEEIMTRGWNEERKSFVQSYEGTALDASILMMPLVFFMAPNDPRMQSTVDAISRPVSKGGLMLDGMLYRYSPDFPKDGLPAGEGTFNVCTFWLVEALTRMGRLGEARWLFEKMLSRANHLGLYSEETSACGDQLGNFPQALTHMGLISAAYNLDRALNVNFPQWIT
jgi:GH15 family glucan-1,4-alpha-glucosidase